MTNSRKYTLLYVAFSLVTALAGGVFFHILNVFFWWLCERYMPFLTQSLISLILYVPVFLASIAGWSAAIFVGWMLMKKQVFFGMKTARDKRRAWRFCRLAFFAAILETAWVITAKSALDIRILPAKLIGCLLVFLLLAALARPYVFRVFPPVERRNRFERFCCRFLLSEIKPYKHIKNLYLSSLLRYVGLVWTLISPLFAYLTAEYIHYANHNSFSLLFVDAPESVLFSLLILYLLYAAILLLVKRGWIATLLLSFVLTGASIADYFKFAMTGDNFYPWDLIEQTKNLGEAMGFVSMKLPAIVWFLIIVEIVMVIVTALSRVGVPLRIQVRIPAAMLLAVCMFVPVANPDKTSDFLSRHDILISDTMLQQTNYSKNGFTTAFTLNVLSMNIEMPENYSEEGIRLSLDKYEDKPAKESFSSPDIILILSESFWDPRGLVGTTFSDNPLANFDEIASRKNTYSGKFYVSVNGGGTVRPEFEVLTGMTTDYLPSGSVPWQYVSRDIPSFVSLYKDLGYHTVSVHPYLASFYNRKETYPYVGFDEMYFANELAGVSAVENVIRGLQTSDESFVNYLKYFLEQDDETDTPSFLFGISMENHAPYAGRFSELTIQVQNPNLNETSLDIVANYVEGIRDTDNAIRMLTDYIDERDRDTILVFFGDHLPYLGTAFSECGMLTSYEDMTPEQAEVMYATPFLIYSNFDMEESNIVSKGKDNVISSYELMNAASQLIGAPQTQFMQLLSDMYDAIPYYNTRLGLEPDETASAYIEAQRLITYDILNGDQYVKEN